ncbi:DUF6083 domain-containing protein [Streptomyces sp. NPDC059441]|uniref:DUF6083 domain-containing protein n=1 Tax=Streptomyces sp. NPDC059441 TaxID=3346829 RepID=UPI0036CE2A1F
MRTTGGRDGDLCQRCGKTDASVRSRGRIDLIAELCVGCWNQLAHQMAQADGATALPPPDFNPDDVTFREPPPCGQCGRDIRVYPTVYDRWVSLGMKELPAKDVPPRFRWRLIKIPSPYSPVDTDLVAVRIRSIEPLPGELVVPAHQLLCPVEEAERLDVNWVPEA